MPPKEDLLFCKIAISTGLVTQAQAQKVLAICTKTEREEGRRPRIGKVFTQFKVLKAPQVQAIYQALDKRAATGNAPAPRSRRGGTSGRGSTSTRHGGGGRSGRARNSRRPERQGPPARAVDPKTLYTGIAFGVLFLLALGIMTWMLMSPSKKFTPESGATTEVAAGSKTSPIAPGKGPAPVAAPAPPPVARPLGTDLELRFRTLLGDLRLDIADNPRRGLASLESARRQLGQLKEQGYTVSSLLASFAALEPELKAALASAAPELEDVDTGAEGVGAGAEPDGAAARVSSGAPAGDAAPVRETKPRGTAEPSAASDGDEEEFSLDKLLEEG